MTNFSVSYRAMNGFKMSDVVEADSPEAAIAAIKACGMLVIIESVVEVATDSDFDDYNDDAADAFWDRAERASSNACNNHFGA